MQAARQIEAACNSLIDELRARPELDQRQISIAQTDFEGGFMRVIRSIARPPRLVAEDQEAKNG